MPDGVVSIAPKQDLVVSPEWKRPKCDACGYKSTRAPPQIDEFLNIQWPVGDLFR